MLAALVLLAALAGLPCTPDDRVLPTVKWDSPAIERHGFRVFAREVKSVVAGAKDPDLMAWKVSPEFVAPLPPDRREWLHALGNWLDDDAVVHRWGHDVLPPLTRYFDFPAGVTVEVYVATFDDRGRYSGGSNSIRLCWPGVRRCYATGCEPEQAMP
jgi:hypothetical protein